MSVLLNFLTKITNKIETDSTIELDEIIFSRRHGHNICVMHVKGKNIFPKMTAEQILSNPTAMLGLGKKDLIRIAQLDVTAQPH